jgi:Ca2+-binding EF-hand superfamily protein
MQMDPLRTNLASISDFWDCCKQLGISLKDDMMKGLLMLYSKHNQSQIDYERALKNMVPILTKNDQGPAKFNIGWTLSKIGK